MTDKLALDGGILAGIAYAAFMIARFFWRHYRGKA